MSSTLKRSLLLSFAFAVIFAMGIAFSLFLYYRGMAIKVFGNEDEMNFFFNSSKEFTVFMGKWFPGSPIQGERMIQSRNVREVRRYLMGIPLKPVPFGCATVPEVVVLSKSNPDSRIRMLCFDESVNVISYFIDGKMIGSAMMSNDRMRYLKHMVVE